jgi:hypothetical protein
MTRLEMIEQKANNLLKGKYVLKNCRPDPRYPKNYKYTLFCKINEHGYMMAGEYGSIYIVSKTLTEMENEIESIAFDCDLIRYLYIMATWENSEAI